MISRVWMKPKHTSIQAYKHPCVWTDPQHMIQTSKGLASQQHYGSHFLDYVATTQSISVYPLATVDNNLQNVCLYACMLGFHWHSAGVEWIWCTNLLHERQSLRASKHPRASKHQCVWTDPQHPSIQGAWWPITWRKLVCWLRYCRTIYLCLPLSYSGRQSLECRWNPSIQAWKQPSLKHPRVLSVRTLETGLCGERMTHGQCHGKIDTTCCVVHGWCAAVPRVLLYRSVESKINHHLQHSFKTLMRMFDMN